MFAWLGTILTGARAARELRDDFARVTRRVDEMDLEFSALMDQVRRLMGRVAKRAAVDSYAPPEEVPKAVTREERKAELRRAFRSR